MWADGLSYRTYEKKELNSELDLQGTCSEIYDGTHMLYREPKASNKEP